jgi:hypothetical protein
MMLDPQLKALVDTEAIRDLARYYAHWVWKANAVEAVALFCEDGVMDMGDRDPLIGRAALMSSYEATFAASIFRPFVHNHVIELNGDRATGTCYLDLRCTVEGVAMQGYGYYDDEYARTDAGWKFRKRGLNMLHYIPDPEGTEGVDA